MDQNEYISIKTTKKMLGVSSQTLRNWDKEGKIHSVRAGNGTGNRMYNKKDVRSLVGVHLLLKEKQKIAYCCVSSKKQIDDLE